MKNLIKTLAIMLTIITLSAPLYSQTVLFDRKVKIDSVRGKWGKNLTNHFGVYGGFGFVAPVQQSAGAEIIFGKASNLELGFIYKRRVFNWFAVGTRAYYEIFNYRIKQTADKIFPDNSSSVKQKMVMQNAGFAPYLRFTFGRHGNIIGTYLDLGVFYNIVLAEWQIQKGCADGFDKKKLNYDYMNRAYWGYQAVLGRNMFSLFAKFNAARVVKNSVSSVDMPPLTVGLRVSI